MTRNIELSLKIILDLAILILSVLCAFYLRFHSHIFPITSEPIGLLDEYIITFILFTPLYILILSFFDIYDNSLSFSKADIFFNRLKASSLAMLLFFTSSFFIRAISYSRVTLILIWVIVILLSYMQHLIWLKIFPAPNALFILNTKDYEQFKDSLLGSIRSSLLIFNTNPDIAKIIELVKTQGIRHIFIIMEDYTRDEIVDLSNQLVFCNCRLNLIPCLMFVYPVRFDQFQFRHLEVLSLKLSILTSFNRILKRVLDIIVSCLMLIFFLPIILIIIVLLKLSGSPIIYSQTRTGRLGQEFKLYKFCSMVKDAEIHTGPVWAVENDQRVTFLGHILRNFSLDELPQLWNIFKGDMSLVGPRPERPFFVEQFSQQWKEYSYRHLVKPGLTGWSQVNGLRGQSSIKERLNYDLYYIYSFTWYLEIKIFIRTLMEFLFHKKAY